MPEQRTPCPHCGGLGFISTPAPSSWTGGPPQISGLASVRCPTCQGIPARPAPRARGYRVVHTLPEDRGELECWTDTLEHACALAQALCQTYGGSLDIEDGSGRPVSCTDVLG